MFPSLTYLLLLLLLFSCHGSSNKVHENNEQTGHDTTLVDSVSQAESIEQTLRTVPKNAQPVFGYRFVVSGDFDGDDRKEKLIEHYYSSVDQKETNKFYDSLTDYDQLVALTFKKDPISFVSSDNNKIDTLHIERGAQLLGLYYLKNEGDLNGDGTDELSYVVQWADWSNCNSWHIVTYKNNQWIELYSFDIWDFQLPDLPNLPTEYSIFGIDKKTYQTRHDEQNQALEAKLHHFKGLVRKVKTNQIEIIYRNQEADLDTVLVDLGSRYEHLKK